jgi:hypothetical protein
MDYTTINELEPTDPTMVSLRTEYFRVTGHYGSDQEIKDWYLNGTSPNYIEEFPSA